MPTCPAPCLLVFEDGDVHRGTHFGHHGESCRDMAFNTAQSGHEEVATDPSCKDHVAAPSASAAGRKAA